MLKLLHTKLDKPKLLTTFPNNSTGSDGDIVISTISGKGTYICVKSNGRWYAANKMEDLSNVGKSSFSKLSSNKLTVKEVENAGSDTDKFLVLDAGNQLKFGTGSETLSDIGALGSLTFGIADTNAVKIDSSSVADDEYARFTANGLESRSTAEVLSDIGAQATVTAGTNCTFAGATLNVDDAFITNNADDTMAGTLTIDKDTTATTTGTTRGLYIDYDHTGISASGQVVRNYGISTRVNSDSPTHVGTVNNFGVEYNITAGTSGTQNNYGLYSTVTGGDTNTGIYQQVDDGGTDLKFVSSADTGDYFSIATTTHGATTISTRDDDATAAHLTLDPDGDLKVIPHTGISTFFRGTNTDDYFSIAVDGDGGAILSTTDAASDAAHLTFDVDGDIRLDSHTGNFIAKKAGTEFSVANSAYAGMILGYRMIGEDGTHASYTLTTSYAVPNSAMTVRFVAPPSGCVEIMIQIYANASSSNRLVYFSLSDNATYNSIGNSYEQLHRVPDETDDELCQHYWTITGLTAGDTYNYWLGSKINLTSGWLNWGGTGSGRYGDFIMKATALPAATSDFAEYD